MGLRVNGTGAPDTELALTVGATDRFEPNHVTWNLHGAGPQILAPTASQSLLRACVILTDCDWAAISSTDIDHWQTAAPDGPTIGWSTYLAHRLLPDGPPEVPGVAVEPVHRGYLLTSTTRPEHTDRSTVLAVASTVMHRRPAGQGGLQR
ncbi:hypothetical protein ACFPIJ_63375 [Dactylosporangium cerinum]|uniref:Uncharacterized protein n=1 Tax=Dactylosporangium cerinum TaxID=1434730 RepID=A0ABV9WMQ4_9ACTN